VLRAVAVATTRFHRRQNSVLVVGPPIQATRTRSESGPAGAGRPRPAGPSRHRRRGACTPAIFRRQIVVIPDWRPGPGRPAGLGLAVEPDREYLKGQGGHPDVSSVDVVCADKPVPSGPTAGFRRANCRIRPAGQELPVGPKAVDDHRHVIARWHDTGLDMSKRPCRRGPGTRSSGSRAA